MKQAWIFILAILALNSFANASNTNPKDCELSLQQIIENSTTCVRKITANKIYLKTDCIFISEKGAYALLNGSLDYAYIPELCTDADGCFIPVNLTSRNGYQTNGDAARNYQKKCPGCGWSYFTSCPNPDCPLKNKNK